MRILEDRDMTGKELLYLGAFLLAWIVLNRWVLPWFGVPTCMSGACSVTPHAAAADRASAAKGVAGDEESCDTSGRGNSCCTLGDGR